MGRQIPTWCDAARRELLRMQLAYPRDATFALDASSNLRVTLRLPKKKRIRAVPAKKGYGVLFD
jgi:hypothetical protein